MIQMCLQGNTIVVNENACGGILQAGGSCGPCEDEQEDDDEDEEPVERLWQIDETYVVENKE